MGNTRDAVGVGDPAPEFTLPDQHGEPVSLSGLLARGRTVILYFYPKDNSPACTVEARHFRDHYDEFVAGDAEVVGVSSDTVASHARFARRLDLPFTLLSDRGGAVRARYGVERTLGLIPGRVTYVIGPDGVVRHVYSSQLSPARHPPEALAHVHSPRSEGQQR